MDICSILKIGLEKQIHGEICFAISYNGIAGKRKPEGGNGEVSCYQEFQEIILIANGPF